MKKLFLFIMIAMVGMTANAQKTLEGSFPNLAGQRKIDFSVDYSQMTIDNKSIHEWLEFRQAQQPDYDAQHELDEELKPQIQDNIVEQVNKKLDKKGIFLAKTDECQYAIVAMPQNVAKKGNNVTKFLLKEKATGNTVAVVEVKGDGGTFGSMSNLWGDGFKDTGKKFGAFIAKLIK